MVLRHCRRALTASVHGHHERRAPSARLRHEFADGLPDAEDAKIGLLALDRRLDSGHWKILLDAGMRVDAPSRLLVSHPAAGPREYHVDLVEYVLGSFVVTGQRR